MSSSIDVALTADIMAQVQTVCAEAVQASHDQAVLLIGAGPLPGTAEWEAEAGTAVAADRQQAWSLAALRIQLATGLDGMNEVIMLRRLGATWAVIGHAAGVTRQTAHERWGRSVLAVLDRYGSGELGGPVAADDPR